MRQRDGLFNFESLTSRATISACGKYRYTLERSWAELPRYVLWLMLNPSTADADQDDATIRRCQGYARAWGYTGILVGNLYAWRATDPRALARAVLEGHDIIGPDNERHQRELIDRASLIVCAWGQLGPSCLARFNLLQLLRPPRPLYSLKINANQEPAHPLRLAAALEPKRWNVFEDAGPGAGG